MIVSANTEGQYAQDANTPMTKVDPGRLRAVVMTSGSWFLGLRFSKGFRFTAESSLVVRKKVNRFDALGTLTTGANNAS